MALKTFNIDEGVYKNYSKHCKNRGISMSKQVENFLRVEIARITGARYEEEINTKRLEKELKDFDKAIEHPLKKYC